MGAPETERIIQQDAEDGLLWREADTLHRLLVDSVQDYAIYALSTSGHIVSWNPGASRLKGYSADEIVGQSYEIFFPPEDRAAGKPKRELERARAEGRFEEEGWRLRKDGTRFWAGVILTPVRNTTGELIGFAKVTRDLTARREAEEQERQLIAERAAKQAAEEAEYSARQLTKLLQAQTEELESRHEEAQALAAALEAANDALQDTVAAAAEARDAAEVARERANDLQQRYWRIFESTPLPMWTVLKDGFQFVEVNSAALERYGYSRDEFLRMHLAQIREDVSVDALRDQLHAVRPDNSLQFITRHRTKKGELLDVEVRMREVVHDGRPAYVAVVMDVTSRLRAESRQRLLVKATEMLSGGNDYHATIARIVKIAVPAFADWAAFNVVEGDRIRTLAIHHPDPDMESLAHEIGERYPMRREENAGAARALATGQAELIREIPDEMLRLVAYDDQHYRALSSIGFRSLINAPVKVGKEVIGVLGFATGESGRLFNDDDLQFAIELARRAGLALQNVRHFEAEHTARDRAERSVARLRRLQQAASAFSGTLDLATTATAIVEEVCAAFDAQAAYLVRRTADPAVLELVHGVGYPLPLEHARTRFPLDSNVPGADVVRMATPIVLSTRKQRLATYPQLADSQITATFGSSATFPLVVRGTAVGAIGLHFDDEREFTDDDVAFLGALAEQAALALERARLYEAEQDARSVAERLQTVTAALSTAVTAQQMADIIVSAGVAAVGATAGLVSLLDETGSVLQVLRHQGFTTTPMHLFERLPITREYPITECVLTGEPIFVTSEAEMHERYPALRHATEAESTGWASLPMVVRGRIIGAIGLKFVAHGGLDAGDREFMLSLASLCAQAMERARLYESEQQSFAAAAAARDRAEFLAEASRQLGASLNYEETLQQVARSAVPRLGDWCAVDMIQDPDSGVWPPTLRRLAVMHSDPAKIEWARELETRARPDWDAPGGLPRVLREGVTEFYPAITDELFVATAKTEEELALLREIGFRAYVCVPLKSRGVVVGAITACMTESERNYDEADRLLAEELAYRASIAIENAELYREAQFANAAKAQFLAVMSHELRTPLNAIGGYAELLDLEVRGPLTDDQRHDIHRIQRSQQHLLALINDVLNFARLEAGQVQYRIEPVPLAPLLQEVADLLLPQARNKSVTIDVHPCSPDSAARADTEKVHQILLNLLSNAVKFTPEHGRISIECRRADEQVEIKVIDTGIGIPSEKLSAIFDPFVQVQSGYSRRNEGTGLGLAISRDLARGMSGDLRVESRIDVGSTFTLTLPLA